MSNDMRNAADNRELAEDMLPLIRVAAALSRRRRLLLFSTVLVPLIAVLAALVADRTYTSQATFLPQSGPQKGGPVAGVAAQFGIVLPSGEASDTPEFYAGLINSRTVLGPLLESEVGLTDPALGGDSVLYGRVLALLEARGESFAERREDALKRMADVLQVSTEPQTGLVRLRVTTASPRLSQWIATRVLALADSVNAALRQQRAGAERRFAESRLEAASLELRAAEDELQGFLQRNRDIGGSPRLTFEQARLQRTVELRQTMVSSLVQLHEQARMSEVRDTPVLSAVEKPEVPPKPDSRHLLLRILLGGFAGLVVGALGVMIAEGLEWLRRSNDPQLHEMITSLPPWMRTWLAH